MESDALEDWDPCSELSGRDEKSAAGGIIWILVGVWGAMHTAAEERYIYYILFDGSFVQHTKQKTEPAKAQITGARRCDIQVAVKSAIFQLLSGSHAHH